MTDDAKWKANRDLRAAEVVIATTERIIATIAEHGRGVAGLVAVQDIADRALEEHNRIMAEPPPWAEPPRREGSTLPPWDGPMYRVPGAMIRLRAEMVEGAERARVGEKPAPPSWYPADSPYARTLTSDPPTEVSAPCHVCGAHWTASMTPHEEVIACSCGASIGVRVADGFVWWGVVRPLPPSAGTR